MPDCKPEPRPWTKIRHGLGMLEEGVKELPDSPFKEMFIVVVDAVDKVYELCIKHQAPRG